MKITFIPLVLLFTLFSSGCIQSIAISTVGGIVHDGFEAIAEESDLDLAENALPANLKLLEVMLKSDPDNRQILLLLGEGYCSYALGFLEDTEPARARALYLRGRDYALRVLTRDPAMKRALEGTLDELQTELMKRGRDDVPALFWAGFGWGGYVYLSLTDPDAIGDLSKVEAIMTTVSALDSTFYYGGSHVFLGTLAGSRPRILGGDVDRSRMYFESALRMNGGRFLMTYVYFARSYAVQTLDEVLFEELLGRVNSASLEILPEFRLANAIAKRKAELLLSKKAELF